MALLGRRTIHLTFWSLPAQTLPCPELRAHRKRKYVPANLVAAPRRANLPLTLPQPRQSVKHLFLQNILFSLFSSLHAPPRTAPHLILSTVRLRQINQICITPNPQNRNFRNFFLPAPARFAPHQNN